MTCDEVRELLPGYVLGALEADETAAVEAHLRDGREHDEELVELRATVLALGAMADERAPSPDLRARVAGIAAAESPAPGAAPTARPLGLASTRRWLMAAAAAVAIVVVFGAGWLAGSRGGAAGGETFALALQGSGGELVRFDGVAGRSPVAVTMAGLERLEPGRAYELWAIRDGRWLRIGVCNTNAQGRWTGDFPFALDAHEDVALTIEPAGGSTGPTSEPILRTQF